MVFVWRRLEKLSTKPSPSHRDSVKQTTIALLADTPLLKEPRVLSKESAVQPPGAVVKVGLRTLVQVEGQVTPSV